MRKDDLRMVGSNMHYFTLPTGYNTKNINLLAYQGTHSNFVVLFKTNTDFYFLYSQEGHNRALEKVTKEKAKDWVRSNAEEYYDDIWGRKHV